MCCYFYCCFCCCCFKNLYTKTLEMLLIIFHSLDIILLLLSLIICRFLEIEYLGEVNFVFFLLMLLMSITLLTFAIILSVWRAKNLIKYKYKKKGITISTISFGLIIFFLFFCIASEFIYIFSYVSFIIAGYFMAYLTFIYLEFSIIIGQVVWYYLKQRIEYGYDTPIPENLINGNQTTTTYTRRYNYEPCKRKIIIIN